MIQHDPRLMSEEPFLLELAFQDDAAAPRESRWVARLFGIGLSALFHLWLFVTLADVSFEPRAPLTDEPIEADFTALPPREEPVDFKTEEPKYELANPNDKEMEVRKSLNAASLGLEIAKNPRLEMAPTELAHLNPNPDSMRLPMYDIPQGQNLSQTMVVHGTTGEGMVQIESALDRVTWEIAQNLQERKVLVVWLIDASGSLGPQRLILQRRLKRIYGELNALEQTEQIPRLEQPILTGVVTFGAKTLFMTKEPTDKFDDVLAAVRNAPTDESGVENVFGAVNQVMDAWHKYRTDNGRRILLVTVTDEAGDDHGPTMELAITKCQRYGAKGYVIGPASPFGRRKGLVPYVAKENGQTYQIPVDLGPETVVVENVDLPFWYEGPQYTYLSSGYGPYALSRLVRETGGVYFLTNMTTNAGLSTVGDFDPGLMKAFEPDYKYSSPDQFMKDLIKHPLRAAVVGAAEYSQTTNLRAQGTPQMEFRVQANNFRQAFTDAQRSAAISSLAVDNILARMPPNVDKLYASEPSARWRLAFSLNYGRLLAQKIRAFEYNSALAQFKTGYAEADIQNKVNHFIFRPSRELTYAPSLRKQVGIAEAHLQRVISEAPGTPWAVMAARELRDGFGIKLIERFIPPAPPAPKNKEAKAKLAPKFANEQKKVATKPTPKPVPPVLPKL